MILKKRILLTIFILSLFSLTSFLVPISFGIYDSNNDNNYTIKESDTFVEDFTTTTYMDAATNAFGWGTGTVTNARDFTIQLLDHYTTYVPVVDVEVQGRKAYLALYSEAITDAITILDINDPTNMKLQGIENSWTSTRAIDINGDVLVAGQNTIVQDSIVLIDTTDPFNPAWKWAYGTDNLITDIEIYGHLAFYTTYNRTNSLRFSYLEDPFVLTGYSKCDWDCDLALGLDVVGGLAYIAASTEGFYVLNITNKVHPTEIGYVNTPGNATDVIVDGGFAYLADGNAGVHVIDVRNPSNPTIISSWDTPGHARKLAKQGRTLYVADEDGGVQIFDVYDPHHITFVAENYQAYTYDVAIFDENLIVGTEDGLYSLRVGHIANFAINWYSNSFELPKVWDVRVVDGIAYLACGPQGLYVVDVSIPNHPVLLDNYTTFYDMRKLDVNGNYIYTVSNLAIFVFNVANPADIKLVDTLSGGGLRDVYCYGELLFVAFTQGFAILNVSNPWSYLLINNFNPGIHNNNSAIWVEGTYVYMVEGDSAGSDTFSCYDITTFSAPVLADSLLRTTPMYDIHVDGDLCYLGAGGWLAVHNVSNPTIITYPGFQTTTSWGVWNFGRYVASAERANGVVLYDVSDVTNLVEISKYAAATGAIQITMDGDYTYAANSDSLVVLRHFESLGDTYFNEENTAQSNAVYTLDKGKIVNATLDFDARIPFGASVTFFMTADGVNWEEVTPGVLHTFVKPGKTLQWRAVLDGARDRSVHLYTVSINLDYKTALIDFSDPLWIGIFAGGGGLILLIIIIAVIVSARRKKKVPTR